MGFQSDTIKNDNICVIWVDDMFDVFTWRNAFGVSVQTPNIDRLLLNGVRFSNAYATVPLCSPCRAELATGLSPFRTGLVDLNRIWREVLPPEKGWVFDLRRAGFYTFTSGKVDGKYKPMSEEYRRILFHEEVAATERYARFEKYIYSIKGPGIKSVGYGNDRGQFDDSFYDGDVRKNACAHLQRLDPTRRHYMQLGFKHPHTPYVCPDRFYRLYDEAEICWPKTACPEDRFGPQPGMATYEHAYIINGKWTPESIGDESWKQAVRGYFAACSHADHEIGKFLDALTASPIGDNTTVVFLSDNGFNLGTHDSFHKMSQWDSAAHIPLGIWSPRMEKSKVIDLPISLHNFPKTIMQLAGLPPRPDWESGQSLLPLIDDSFGDYDTTKSPVTSVFGTLSVRPSEKGLEKYRYFRYPNGEEHVYDLENDPGETVNIVDQAPLQKLREILIQNALELGLDLRNSVDPANGINAMMSLDGSVVLRGGSRDNHYWAYGHDAEKIEEEKNGGDDTLWYMGGPDGFVLNCPMNVETVRIATVAARHEEDPEKRLPKTIQVVAHPETPINFEASERVDVDVRGSRGNDILIGPRYGSATLFGGAGNDHLISMNDVPGGSVTLFGGSGDDRIESRAGRDKLYGGAGNDWLIARGGRSELYGGYGNDRFTVGEGTSQIETGPGCNHVTLDKGDQTVTVGTGVNHISPGVGGVVFKIAWGGVTIIDAWRPRQRYDLSDWPELPKITRLQAGELRLSSGLSIVTLHDVPPNHDIMKQIIF